MAKPTRINRTAAQDVAIAALTFITHDTDLLSRFLALSGIDPDGVRAAAAEPGFLAGVLDYVCGDEALLVAFATHSEIDPAAIDVARHVLSDS
jgi:hypothetical protein